MLSFQSDNFSTKEIKYKEFVGDKSFIIKVLNQYFDNFKVQKVFQLDRPEINSENYKIIITRAGKKQVYLLRKFKVLKNQQQINFYLDLLNDLKKKGLTVSSIIKSKNGQLSVSEEKKIYSLFDFIEAEYFSPNKAAFKSAIRAIARMHRCFNQLLQKYSQKIDILSKKGATYFNRIKKYSLDDFKEIKNIIQQKKNKTEIELLILENIIFFQNVVKEVASHRNSIKKLSRQIIHSDLHPHNLLVSDNKVKAIVDFDGVRISQQARDVAFAIYRLGRQFFIKSSFAKVRKEAPRLRDLFIEEYQKIKKLSAEEIKLMPILLKDEFIRKLLFVLKGMYLENNQTWATDLPKFVAALKEIDYFWPQI